MEKWQRLHAQIKFHQISESGDKGEKETICRFLKIFVDQTSLNFNILSTNLNDHRKVPPMSKDFLKQLQLLQSENSRLQLENDHLKSLLTKEQLKDFKGLMQKYQVNNTGEVNKFSSSKEKIALFMSLFKGRNDICAKKWKNKSGYSPYCFNDFRPGVCFKPKIKCKDCFQADFAPLDEIRIEKHLKGDYVLGLYPMTEKDTCFLLVMDFDESTWQEDVKVVNEVCRLADIPVYTERSRSGNGAHLWYFFAEEISAALARRFGTAILNKAMETGKNIKFNSCDRLFPKGWIWKFDCFTTAKRGKRKWKFSVFG